MSALDAANWARTVGAFQEVYKASTNVMPAKDTTERFMSNSSVGGKEANAAGNSMLAQGYSMADATASAR